MLLNHSYFSGPENDILEPEKLFSSGRKRFSGVSQDSWNHNFKQVGLNFKTADTRVGQTVKDAKKLVIAYARHVLYAFAPFCP